MQGLTVFVTDGGAAGLPGPPLPRSFTRRADLLLRALLADLAALPGVEVVHGIDRAAAVDTVAAIDTVAGTEIKAMPASAADGASVTEPGPARSVADGAAGYMVLRSAAPSAGAPEGQCNGLRLDAGAETADAVWPLALESGGMLERLSYDTVLGGRILLGCPPDVVRAVSSKRHLARILSNVGVAVAATYPPDAVLPPIAGPWVVKPDDGAGCLHTRLFSDCAGALAWIRARPVQDYVLQPFVAGKPGSLSLVCCDGMVQVLACNQERVAMRDNRFHVLGSVVNGLGDDDGALARLARQVVAAIPGLWGYVGINFVLTAGGAVVLDVNPRLTVAYAGLHASIGRNPAGMVLDLLRGPGALPDPAPPGRRRAVSVDLGLT